MIQTATQRDASFCRHLASQHTDAIGAVSGLFLHPFISKGWVHVAMQDGQHAGMILHRPTLSYDARVTPIIAAAVPFDLQRRSVGRSLLAHLEDECLLHRTSMLQAWCAADLPACLFWRDMGFTPVAVKRPMGVRRRPLICWRRYVLDASRVGLETVVPDPRARVGGGRFAAKTARSRVDAMIVQDPRQMRDVLAAFSGRLCDDLIPADDEAAAGR